MAGTLVTGVISCLFMVTAVLIIDPAKGTVLDLAEEIENVSGSMNILGMFTVGDFPLLFSRSNLMALTVFTVIFSIAIVMSGEKGKPVLKLVEALSDIIVNVIGIVMKLAPIGLGCYFSILIGEHGEQVVGPLSCAILMYCVVIVLYFIVLQTAMAYIGAGAAGVKHWWQTAMPSTLTALGTCSSAATLPVNLIQGK